jgi:hypothetical protein
MSAGAAPAEKWGHFRRHEVVLAVACAIVVQGGALFLLRAADLRRPAELPEIDRGPAVPVKVVPVLDLDAPTLKFGGKRDKFKLPDRWVKPRQKPRVEEKAFVSTKAEKTEEAIPPKEIEVAKADTPVPPPEAERAKEVEAKVEPPAEAPPPPNVDTEGHEDGSKSGTETDPLKARAVDIYREKIRGWFSRRFRVSGSGLPAEEITKVRVSASVSISAGRTVASYTIHPSGNAAFDAAARSALESAKGDELPPPPENYPDIVQSQISLTFTCTAERCD